MEFLSCEDRDGFNLDPSFVVSSRNGREFKLSFLKLQKFIDFKIRQMRFQYKCISRSFQPCCLERILIRNKDLKKKFLPFLVKNNAKKFSIEFQGIKTFF
jgi:hypothetical protein